MLGSGVATPIFHTAFLLLLATQLTSGVDLGLLSGALFGAARQATALLPLLAQFAPGRTMDLLESLRPAAAGRAADRCSHGMRRRADLARLLLVPPRLLLLDEPQAGLDASAQPLVEELIRQVRSGGGGAILVSHDPQGLSGLADRMLTLRSGALEGAT